MEEGTGILVTYMPELVDLGVEEWQRSSGDKL